MGLQVLVPAGVHTSEYSREYSSGFRVQVSIFSGHPKRDQSLTNSAFGFGDHAVPRCLAFGSMRGPGIRKHTADQKENWRSQRDKPLTSEFFVGTAGKYPKGTMI